MKEIIGLFTYCLILCWFWLWGVAALPAKVNRRQQDFDSLCCVQSSESTVEQLLISQYQNSKNKNSGFFCFVLLSDVSKADSSWWNEEVSSIYSSCQKWKVMLRGWNFLPVSYGSKFSTVCRRQYIHWKKIYKSVTVVEITTRLTANVLTKIWPVLVQHTWVLWLPWNQGFL